MHDRLHTGRDQAFVVAGAMNGKSRVVIPIAEARPATAGGGCGSSCGPSGGDDTADTLMRDGWILRTTIGEPRLSELVENYKSMGYEVHVEYFGDAAQSSPDGQACTTCFDAADRSDEKQRWGSVYVRPGKPGASGDEDLF